MTATGVMGLLDVVQMSWEELLNVSERGSLQKDSQLIHSSLICYLTNRPLQYFSFRAFMPIV